MIALSSGFGVLIKSIDDDSDVHKEELNKINLMFRVFLFFKSDASSVLSFNIKIEKIVHRTTDLD